jgi:hypothetical protein
MVLVNAMTIYVQYSNNLSQIKPSNKLNFPKLLREKAEQSCKESQGSGIKCFRAEKFLFDPNDGSVASIIYRCPVK